MNKEEAEKLSITLLQALDLLDQSAAFVKDKDTEENWSIYKEAVGKAMFEICVGLGNPLYERFPELKPESLGGPYRVDAEIYEPRFYDSTSKTNE